MTRSGYVNGIDADEYIAMVDALDEVKTLRVEVEDNENYIEELEDEILKLKKELVKSHLNDWRFGNLAWQEEELTRNKCEYAVGKREYLESIGIDDDVIEETVVEEYRARMIEKKIEEVKENGTAE